MSTVAGAALVASAVVWAGCEVSVVDPLDGWPDIEEVQLAVNDMTVRLRRNGRVRGPVPVLRRGENPVVATAFRRDHGGHDQLVQSPRFALEFVRSPWAPVVFTADSTSTLMGTLVASDTARAVSLRVMLVEPATGRVHFGPATFDVAIIAY